MEKVLGKLLIVAGLPGEMKIVFEGELRDDGELGHAWDRRVKNVCFVSAVLLVFVRWVDANYSDTGIFLGLVLILCKVHMHAVGFLLFHECTPFHPADQGFALERHRGVQCK